MSKNILLHFEIPLGKDIFGPTMTFNRWIPGEENPINFKDEQFNLRLWVDEDCIFPKGSDEFVPDWINTDINGVNKIKAEIQIQNIDDELATFIYDERESSRGMHHGIKPTDERYDDLNIRFNKLGSDTVKLTYEICNRFISYVRNEKGQYLLESLTYDKEDLHSVYVQTHVKAKINEGEWFRLNPYQVGVMALTLGDNKECITQENWYQIQEFVPTKKRTNLATELISNSMSLLYKYGHSRSALIEAATALEIVLVEFSKNLDFEKFDLPTDIGRIDIANLGNQVKHLGFSASIRYLLPILFTKEVLSTELINKCQDAILARNGIIHGGQRHIKIDIAEKHVLALKQCSEILMEYTITA